MRLLDPGALANARYTGDSTLSPLVEIRAVASVPGEFGDVDIETTVWAGKGRLRLLKADETPSGMSVQSQASYLVTVPAGTPVDSSMRLLVGDRAYNVVGADDAPLGGEIVRRLFAERV